jgi:hypothetical protein
VKEWRRSKGRRSEEVEVKEKEKEKEKDREEGSSDEVEE